MRIVKLLGSIVGILLVLLAGFLIWVLLETRVPTNIEQVTPAPRGDTLLSSPPRSDAALVIAPFL
jgi:hypothetical protein